MGGDDGKKALRQQTAQRQTDMLTELGGEQNFARTQQQTADTQGDVDYSNIMGRYKNIADTGGYSPQDLSAIRARGNAPITSAYASANRDVDRAKTLTGGSANYGAVKAKMAREQGAAGNEANVNT